jgi:hypothetical protein
VAFGVIFLAAVSLTAALAHRARLSLFKRPLPASEPARTTQKPSRRVKTPRAGSVKAVALGGVYVLNPVCKLLPGHFNYVQQMATAGGKVGGHHNPATNALSQTPEPEESRELMD